MAYRSNIVWQLDHIKTDLPGARELSFSWFHRDSPVKEELGFIYGFNPVINPRKQNPVARIDVPSGLRSWSNQYFAASFRRETFRSARNAFSQDKAQIRIEFKYMSGFNAEIREEIFLSI